MKSTRFVAALGAALTAALVAACSAGSSTNPNPSASGGGAAPGSDKLTVGLVAEPVSLDFTTNDGAAIPQALLYNVYETLVKLDQNGDIKPALATSWKVSSDRKTYTFDLTDKAKFTNGQPFTAKDAVFSIDRVKKDWTTSLKSAMDVVADAKAVSDTQLQVTLKQPSNSWLYKMTTRIGAMMAPDGIADLATKPVGTGPYEFGTWNRGDSISLKANPNYWGPKPHFGEVVLKYFKDATALNNALLTGTINVIGTVQAPESLKQFEGNSKYQVIEGTTNGEVVLSFNNVKAPMNNLKVRQAVRYAINHKALMDTCWAGYGTLIGSMVPPTDPWYEDLTGLYPYDLAKAKQLVQETGVANTTLRLRIPTLPYAVSCGQVVKSDLEQAGFKVALDQLEFPAAWLTTVFKNADYDMSIVAHVEPRDLGAVFGNPQYYTRYDNKQVQQDLAKADTGTPQEQITYMKAAAKTLSEDAAADFLFLLPNLIVADKGITGLPKNAISESFDLSQLGRS
ncbi:peptide ABC transporter substrate-binding protein [Intrasporangium chromatireducens Q5-1]|uniref:Peptide ABC transporter substrate-binding protein n=1 Tax=Intrasporangium chromatireducens Q5-1 TaxID=584657 RepID=W9GGU3_9MICO|nr:ABC transporter substrate-binding protein [Intrasporangium chromatireducens]EWT05461.1 peptide ABC transporter substrate-binding protein [Intrasporangium chromatireducens Q5-1]